MIVYRFAVVLWFTWLGYNRNVMLKILSKRIIVENTGMDF